MPSGPTNVGLRATHVQGSEAMIRNKFMKNYYDVQMDPGNSSSNTTFEQ